MNIQKPPVSIEEIKQIVENQVKNNDPPQVSYTYNRLIRSGYSRTFATTRIALVLYEHRKAILKQNNILDLNEYVTELDRLPE